MLSFGVTALPDPPYTRLVEVFQNGEGKGFEYGWTYDSHILWQDSYATLPIAAVQTEKIKLGHCVTNPGSATRRSRRAGTRRCTTSPTAAR